MKRVLIVGASGFLGTQLLDVIGQKNCIGTYNQTPRPTLVKFDVRNGTLAALQAQTGARFSSIIFANGVTNIGACTQNPIETKAVNVQATIRLADEAASMGILPVYMSSDGVFDGYAPPYHDDATPTPPNEYGRQKADVEQWFKAHLSQHLIVRIPKLMGIGATASDQIIPLANDLIRGVPLRMAVDQIYCPTYVRDAAEAISQCLSKHVNGTINIANPIAMSRYAFAQAVLNAVMKYSPNVPARIEPCKLGDLPFSEPRSLDTTLICNRLTQLRIPPFKQVEELCSMILR